MHSPNHLVRSSINPACAPWWQRLWRSTQVTTLALSVGVAPLLSACGGSDDSTTAADANATLLAAMDPAISCTALGQHDFSATAEAPASVTSATVSGGNCVVTGTINGTQNFQMKLPTAGWTQRFMMSGCGGYCGSVGDART